MPSPVAANDLSPISGSVQTSRISYAVEPAGKDYGQNYNGTTWYSDIPNDGQRYTIVSDNYTANYYVSRSQAGGGYVEGGLPAVDEYSAPVFWQTVGTSSLDIITIVNGLPDRVGETPFDSGSQALNWVASSSNYFAVGPDYYRDIDADNLVMYVEGNQIISYPTTGSTWYDLAGYGVNGTLVNGPIFDSNGWIDFDGTNDYIEILGTGFQGDVLPSSSYVNRTLTLETIVKFDATSGTGGLITKWGNSLGQTWGFWRYPTTKLHLALDTSAGYSGLYSTGDIGGDVNRFYHASVTVSGSDVAFYINGAASGTSTANAGSWDLTPKCPVLIGAQNTGSATNLNGQIASTKVYSRALSASDIAQNYYGGPIVTDNLVYHVDFGNLVSYPKSGTNAYDMSGTVGDTSLVNGPTFTPNNGGALLFDGTDDYGNNSDSALRITGNVTMNAWIRHNGTGASNGNYMAHSVNNGYRMRRNGVSGSPLWMYSNGNLVTGGAIDDNIWYMVTAVFSSTGLRAYINGELVGSNSTPYSPNTGGWSTLLLGSYNGSAEMFGGEIAMAQIYSKSLTQEEIQQNYNATN